MKVKETAIEGLLIIEPGIYEDNRGYFYESYNKEALSTYGIDAEFVQDNISHSRHGVLRGMHYQAEPYAQAKLVRVLSGEVLDIAVDIRKGSPTFGKWVSVVLSAENKRQFYIPRGFAHGFLVRSASADFFYKCDNFYSKEHESGFRFDDPGININWDFDPARIILSEKDQQLPPLAEARNNFDFQALKTS